MNAKRILLFILALCMFCACFLTGCTSGGGQGETTEAVIENDPSLDDEMNILLIGNSYSYYWPDELWGLLNASGVENLTICNVYYSGCTFEKHWTWHEAGESHYRLCTNDANGRREQENYNLKASLAVKNWDIISFQQSNGYMYTGGVVNQRASIEPYLGALYNYVYEQFPGAKYYWPQSWSHEIGNGVADEAEQKTVTEGFRTVADEVCEKYGFTKVPCGDAWLLIRHDPLVTADGRTLTYRIKGEELMDDLTHDGDVGGGQYLNACVWYEVLTGKSVVGHTWRPEYTYQGEDYSLSEDMIALLQNAAHTAVANVYGEDYAK